MAMKEVKTRTGARPDLLSQQETARGVVDDLQRLIAHVQENPLLYVAALVFVAVCVAAGAIYGMRKEARDRQFNTAYAEAIRETDPALRAAALANLDAPTGEKTAEVLFMEAQAAIEAGEYATAMTNVEAILADHYETPYAARAHLILGFLAEKDANWEDAIEAYNDLIEGWPDTFWARRVHYRIGEVQEKLGNWAQAKAAYEEQMQVFPDSAVATRSEVALDKLRQDHPELFPEQENANVEAATTEGATAAEPSAAVEIVEDPATPLPPAEPVVTPIEEGAVPVPAPPAENEGTITIPQQVPNIGELMREQEPAPADAAPASAAAPATDAEVTEATQAEPAPAAEAAAPAEQPANAEPATP